MNRPKIRRKDLRPFYQNKLLLTRLIGLLGLLFLPQVVLIEFLFTQFTGRMKLVGRQCLDVVIAEYVEDQS